MKQYIVTVNGTQYEVSIESQAKTSSYSASSSVRRPASAPIAAPSIAAAPIERKLPEVPVSSDSNTVNSPMNGTILSVKVVAGQTVKKGDVMFILEAMKMENEIFAPHDATIASVAVSQGSAVDPGQLLCTFE